MTSADDPSAALFERAQAVIPGGVNSPVRAFGSVGGTPRFIASAEGARMTDVAGTSYLDYIGSWGPMILGHAHPAVVEAATAAVARGSSYGAPTAGEVELAETIAAAIPGVDMVRLVSSGTEATMSAIRLARGVTGRSKVVKFRGHYHGHADALLVDAGSGVATLGLPDSPGVTSGAAADTLVLDWNAAEQVESAFAEHGGDIAVLVCEPIPANMGVVPAEPGFLQLLRDLTRGNGALLLFDEVISGFRVGRGGATARYGITPDLVTLGKVVGGGFPLAAFGGSRDVMSVLAPLGAVYQAGTLSGNPVAVAAGLATLALLDDAAFDALEQSAARLADGLADAFASSSLDVVVQREASLFTVFFTDRAVRDYAGAKACDHTRYAHLFRQMLARGHYLPPSGYECIFVSLAHTEQDLDTTIAAAKDVATALAAGDAR